MGIGSPSWAEGKVSRNAKDGVDFAECQVIEVVRGINGGWEDSIKKDHNG
jgi:hypothetical protein